MTDVPFTTDDVETTVTTTEKTDRVTAPFTVEQSHSLNEFQHSGRFHPYTCGNDSRHQVLAAGYGPSGWVCLDCDYRQNWAHAFSADWSWKRGSAAQR